MVFPPRISISALHVLYLATAGFQRGMGTPLSRWPDAKAGFMVAEGKVPKPRGLWATRSHLCSQHIPREPVVPLGVTAPGPVHDSFLVQYIQTWLASYAYSSSTRKLRQEDC